MTVHHASWRPVQAKWHNIPVCFHCPQSKFITSHLQMHKPIDAIIIQNILFVTDGKWWCIFLPNGSDVNLLKHDVVKWQKQRHTHAHTPHTRTYINSKCGVTPRCIMNNMNHCHHYPTQCICYHCTHNEVSVWWLVQSPIAQLLFIKWHQYIHAVTHTTHTHRERILQFKCN